MIITVALANEVRCLLDMLTPWTGRKFCPVSHVPIVHHVILVTDPPVALGGAIISLVVMDT